MTLEEAIKHCEEVAHQNEILMKRYDDASGYSRSHNEQIRTSGAIGCEQLISLYRQLAEWLKELAKYREIFNKIGEILNEYGYTIDDLDTIEEVNADEDRNCIIRK